MSAPVEFALVVNAGEVGASHSVDSPQFNDFSTPQPLWLSFIYSATRASGTDNVTIHSELRWLNSAGAYISSTSNDLVLNATVGNTLTEFKHTPPAGAASGTCRFTVTPAASPMQHKVAIMKVRLGKTQRGATFGADWSSNIVSRPTNLSSLTGSEGILNTNLSVGSNGALLGGGGGQVTIGGLGFSGDLNATYGATWGGNLTGPNMPIDNAGRVLDTRADDSAPSVYYAKGMGQYHEFKSFNFSSTLTAASGFCNLVTIVQWINTTGGPVKQTLTDSTGQIFERVSTGTTTWGAWSRNYNGAYRPRLGGDVLDSTGSSLGDADVRNNYLSVGSNGALLGGGGGQVTIGGLGFSGDLNATYGATWGGNLTGRPSNLSSLTGSEGINNGLVSVGANGALLGGGGGQVTIRGIGYTGDLNAGTSGVLSLLGSYSSIAGNSVQKAGGTHGAWEGGAVGLAQYRSAFIQSSLLSVGGGGWITVLALDANATNYNRDSATFAAEYQASGSGTGNVYLFAAGTIINGGAGTPVTGVTSASRMALAYDGSSVAVLIDGVKIAATTAAANQRLFPKVLDYFDSAILPDTIHDILYGPYGDAAWINVMPPVQAAGGRYYFNQSPTYSAAAGTPATSTISLAAGSLTIGSTVISYNAMSIGVTGTGGSTAVYNLYIDDPHFSGGTQSLQATTSSTLPYQNDGRIYLGQVSVTFPTSGSGTGTGTGGGGGGFTCVSALSWVETDHGFVLARDITPGDRLVVLDEATMEGTTFESVTHNELAEADGWEIFTADRKAVLYLSAQTPLTLRAGATIFPCQLVGQELPVKIDGEFSWAPCFALPLGRKLLVSHISCSSKTYAAGNDRDGAILTHNLNKP